MTLRIIFVFLIIDNFFKYDICTLFLMYLLLTMIPYYS